MVPLCRFLCLGHQCGFILCLAGLCTLSAEQLAESDVVEIALANNPDIRVAALEQQRDSLDLHAAHAGWRPEVDIGATESLELLDSLSLTASNDPSFSSDLTARLTQPVPGGGAFSANLTQGASRLTRDDSSSFTHTVSVEYTQPFLREAGRYSEPSHAIIMARFSHQTLSLTRKKEVLTTLSNVRAAYWDYYQACALYRVYETDQERAIAAHEAALARFRLGTASRLDTLSATLALLEARQELLESDYTRQDRRRDLALLLAQEPDSLQIAEEQEITFISFPGHQDFLQKARDFDPQLQIFATAARRLTYLLGFRRNQLLPHLAAGLRYSRGAQGTSLGDDSRSFSTNAVIELVLGYSLPTVSHRVAVQKTRLEKSQNVIKKEEHRRRLDNRVAELFNVWEQEREMVALAGLAREVAENKYAAVQAANTLGTAGRLELLEARTSFLRSSAAHIQKQVLLKKTEIVFDEISGALLTRFGLEFK